MRLANKVAVVTGSSRGIGRGIAERLAAEGASVVVNGRSAATLEPVVAAIQSTGGRVIGVPADVGYIDQVTQLFAETVKAFGGVDILVNNAAWAGPTAHFLEMDEAHWDEVIRTNLKSVFLCSSQAVRLMVDQKKEGAIVSISSFAAARSHRAMAAYDATKGGLEAMTRAMALDMGPFGIRANVVGPGPIHTENGDARGPEAQARRAEIVPLGRVGYPADIAGAVAFLASDDASFITGQTIYVDGGMLTQLRPATIDRPLPESVAKRNWRPRPEPRPLRAWK
jgi:NAD(P)-dependent dehydrogenase (short-subunit alcohol dehydrogenase family)